jgi:hypothetical protein
MIHTIILTRLVYIKKHNNLSFTLDFFLDLCTIRIANAWVPPSLRHLLFNAFIVCDHT